MSDLIVAMVHSAWNVHKWMFEEMAKDKTKDVKDKAEIFEQAFCVSCVNRNSSICTDNYECNYERFMPMHVHMRFLDVDSKETTDEYIK